VPEGVRRKVDALGSAGRQWLETLSETIAALCEEWKIDVGVALGGGSTAYVAHATSADGSPAVLKVAMPDGLDGNGDFARELETVRVGQGHGYVRLLQHAVDRRATLQERLGRPLEELDLPIEDQIQVVARTVSRGWHHPPNATTWRTGAEQARYLHESIERSWVALGQPCRERTIGVALRCAASRADAFDTSSAVLIHGDAHPGNVLEDLTEPETSGGFKLIDPDGMLSEPAHDLAIPLRGWNDELLLMPDPVESVRGWCAQLEDAMTVSAQAIWEWALAERVSSGLFLLRLGDPEGARFLEVADALALNED
jgi:streptomycin 6-kinase